MAFVQNDHVIEEVRRQLPIQCSEKGSTPQSVAQSLAGAIANADSSFLTDSRGGNVDVLVGNFPGGSNTDWTITVSPPTWLNTVFASPSFTATGSTMVDGTNSRAGNGVVYSYVVPTGGYAPNGDLLAISDSVTGDWAFSYDALDRLNTAQAMGTGNTPSQYLGLYGCWSYDSYGNRLSEAMSSTACNSNPPLVSWADYSTSNNNQMTTTSMTTGQSSPTTSGYVVSYDASGNVLWDGYNRYWYDGEGRICASEVNGGGQAYQYVYDPEGARIAVGTLTSVQPYGNTCDWPFSLSQSHFALQNQFLVDLSGDQVTELNTSTYNTLNANGLGFEHSNVWIGGQLNVTYDNWGVHFNFEDPLGTKRAVADIAGDVDETCTTLPWGNDISSSGGNVLPLNIVYNGYPVNSDCVPNNSTQFNSLLTSDGSEHRFTQKEWDPFTGNDYFLARYYSPYFGRFLSPDWSANVSPVPYATFTDPQSLNLYAYVRNNPLTRVDPDGHGQCQGFECQMQQDWIAQHQVGNLNNQQVSDAGLVRISGGNGDPTLPAEVQPPPPSLMDKVGTALLPKTPTDLALLVLPDGLGELAKAGTSLMRGLELSAKLTEEGVSGAEKVAKLTEEGDKLFPSKAGNFEMHHNMPKRLAGAEDGPLTRLPASYHQFITSATRTLTKNYTDFSAGANAIMDKVYSYFPIQW
jgi:RHS repeat-associated protein